MASDSLWHHWNFFFGSSFWISSSNQWFPSEHRPRLHFYLGTNTISSTRKAPVSRGYNVSSLLSPYPAIIPPRFRINEIKERAIVPKPADCARSPPSLQNPLNLNIFIRPESTEGEGINVRQSQSHIIHFESTHKTALLEEYSQSWRSLFRKNVRGIFTHFCVIRIFHVPCRWLHTHFPTIAAIPPFSQCLRILGIVSIQTE